MPYPSNDMTETDFLRMYEKCFRPLCLYALHYVADTDMAEDIVQDSFVAFWEKYREKDREIQARATIYTIVRNRCIDYLRRTSSARMLPEDAERLMTDDEAQTQSSYEARLWSAIDRLPERRRQILLMNKRDGMSYKEIAEELGLSIFTVRNHLAITMKVLRKETQASNEILMLVLSCAV